jgi:hypothetical protein
VADDDAAEAIRAEFASREKALEHQLDHKPCECNIELAINYSARQPAAATTTSPDDSRLPRARRLPQQVNAPEATRQPASPARVVRLCVSMCVPRAVSMRVPSRAFESRSWPQRRSAAAPRGGC